MRAPFEHGRVAAVVLALLLTAPLPLVFVALRGQEFVDPIPLIPLFAIPVAATLALRHWRKVVQANVFPFGRSARYAAECVLVGDLLVGAASAPRFAADYGTGLALSLLNFWVFGLVIFGLPIFVVAFGLAIAWSYLLRQAFQRRASPTP